MFCEVQGVLLAGALYVLVAHHFDSLLFCLEFSLEDLKFDSVFSKCHFVLLQTRPELPELLADAFLVHFEEPDLFRVQLVELTLFLDHHRPSVEILFLNIEAVKLFLQRLVDLLHASVLFFELSQSLLVVTLLGCQLSR